MDMKMCAGITQNQIVDFVRVEQIGDGLGRAIYAVGQLSILLKRQLGHFLYMSAGGHQQPATVGLVSVEVKRASREMADFDQIRAQGGICAKFA